MALSLHRKIPFLADKVSHGSPTSADWQRRLFWGVPSIPLSKWSPGLRMLVLAVPASWSPLLRRDSVPESVLPSQHFLQKARPNPFPAGEIVQRGFAPLIYLQAQLNVKNAPILYNISDMLVRCA